MDSSVFFFNLIIIIIFTVWYFSSSISLFSLLSPPFLALSVIIIQILQYYIEFDVCIVRILDRLKCTNWVKLYLRHANAVFRVECENSGCNDVEWFRIIKLPRWLIYVCVSTALCYVNMLLFAVFMRNYCTTMYTIRVVSAFGSHLFVDDNVVSAFGDSAYPETGY